MNKPSKLSLTLLILTTAFAVVTVTHWIKQSRQADAQVAMARSAGNPKASGHIVEYIDFQCPACARGVKMLEEYLNQYPDQIFLEVKYFPLTTAHRHALRSARYAECAARQGQFLPFMHEVMERQHQWKNLINADGVFQQIAKNNNMHKGKLEACLRDERVSEIIFADKTTGSSLGIRSTPTYFVNGKMVVGTTELKKELNQYF